MLLGRHRDLINRGLLRISRGFAFRGKAPIGSATEHICVVVGSMAERPGHIVRSVYFTTKVDSARKRLKNDPAALVTLDPAEYPELTESCCVQCARAYVVEIAFDEFIQGLDDGTYTYAGVGQPDRAVVDKIMAGLTASDSFSTADLARLFS